VSSPSGVRAKHQLKTNLGHIKCLWLKENKTFRETFITAYTSARTITGHQLAKIACSLFSELKGKDQRRKIGNTNHCSHYFFSVPFLPSSPPTGTAVVYNDIANFDVGFDISDVESDSNDDFDTSADIFL